MREIKFRAWDSTNNEMVYGVHLNDGKPVKPGFQWFNPQNTVHNAEPMQYTGLKDQNGIEIYEGDVVIAKSMGQTVTCEVRWSAPTARFFLFGAKNSIVWNLSGSRETGADVLTEVIGNVYENPDLLTKE